MGEIIPSESLSRVTYTGIDGMHSRKTKQPYIPSARKNRTIMKCAANVLSKKEEKRKDTRKIVKMSLLCKAGVFLTVNHRGPLPLRELHSTDETLAWRDPRGY